jgi:hypothetical protein
MPLSAAELLQGIFSEEVVVDLRAPVYRDGILETDQGGVIQARNVRVQAMHIRYERSGQGENQKASLLAESDLSVEFRDILFVGERIEYDFLQGSGIIYNGRVAIGPWLFGGRNIYLHANGTCSISHAFVTTDSSESERSWQLQAKSVSLLSDGTLLGKSLALYVGSIPILWLPRLTFDPMKLTESPFGYTVGWGGKQGPRVGIKYLTNLTRNFKAGARVDLHIKHGLGAGVETRYHSDDHKTTFKTINYLARDITVNLERQYHTRYRFQGVYKSYIEEGKWDIDLSYDKVSDIEMPSDYSESSLGITAAGKSQLLARKESNSWLITGQARARLNSFQTMKQQLPSLEWSYRPRVFANTGLLYDSRCKAAYLDYDYSHTGHSLNDYHSTRLEFVCRAWRPFSLAKVIHITPEVQGVAVCYGNSTNGCERHAMATAIAKVSCSSTLSRSFKHVRHLIIPYSCYSYAVEPTLKPNQHFIFDIEDGWTELNVMRFGIRQKFFRKNETGFSSSALVETDLYADTFFNTEKVHHTIPRLYLNLGFFPSCHLRFITGTAWYFPKNILDHINVRTEWVANANFAVATEYRSRSRYCWRKVNIDNLMMDSYRSVGELLHSPVSDQRETILVHSFWRFHPFMALEGRLKKGWHRRHEPSYSEYDASLLLSLPAHWYLKFSYQRSEDDHRFALYFALRPPPSAAISK